MQSILYGRPIVHSTAALKALVANFRMYTEAQPLSNDSDEAQYEETMQAIDLIKGSISQIDFAKTSLQALIDKMKDTYENTKNKEEKKALLQEIEQIDQETHFNDVIGEAVELQFMLGTRLTETVSNQRRLERKLGILTKVPPGQSVHEFYSNSQNRNSSDGTPFATQFDDETEASTQLASTVRTMSPPRLCFTSENAEERATVLKQRGLAASKEQHLNQGNKTVSVASKHRDGESANFFRNGGSQPRKSNNINIHIERDNEWDCARDHETTAEGYNANNSLGTIHIERLPTELHCSKRTLFFTRDTRIEVFSATRCAQMGSCRNDVCSKIRYDSEIAEFANASKFPGYSGCERSCGGLICGGCLLPFPACSFYRIAHIPVNKMVYEVVNCMEWRPLIRLRVHISLSHYREEQATLIMRPYVSQKRQDVSFNVISYAKPTCPLLTSRFAIAHEEALLIPEQMKMATTCSSYEEAVENFHLCRNNIICDCDTGISPARCNCPQAPIATMRADPANKLPVSSPFVKLIHRQGSIVALSRREELTVSIEAKFIKDSVEYVTSQNCIILLHNLTGCYSCQEGATLRTSCYTAIPTWIVLECDDHVFSVECDSTNKSSVISLDF
ncbi:hypothetical protein OSTOST_00122 [Ostertagia ostertagi]